MRIATLTVLIVAAAPQTEDRQVVTGEGVDIMLALDMSISMNAVDLTEDELLETLGEGRPRSRFEIIRDTLQELRQSLSGPDRLGGLRARGLAQVPACWITGVSSRPSMSWCWTDFIKTVRRGNA